MATKSAIWISLPNSTMIAPGCHIKIAGLVWLVISKTIENQQLKAPSLRQFTFGLAAVGNVANEMEQLVEHIIIARQTQAKLRCIAVHSQLETQPPQQLLVGTASVLPACKQIKSLAWKQSKFLLDCLPANGSMHCRKQHLRFETKNIQACGWVSVYYGAIVGPESMDACLMMCINPFTTKIPMKPATKPSINNSQ